MKEIKDKICRCCRVSLKKNSQSIYCEPCGKYIHWKIDVKLSQITSGLKGLKRELINI